MKDDGARGFVIGIFQGLAGVATKPMVGCLDAVTHTGEAVREMAGGLAAGEAVFIARRARFPQPFGPDGRMMPRTVETACGALLLARFPMWKVGGSFGCVDVLWNTYVRSMIRQYFEGETPLAIGNKHSSSACDVV